VTDASVRRISTLSAILLFSLVLLEGIATAEPNDDKVYAPPAEVHREHNGGKRIETRVEVYAPAAPIAGATEGTVDSDQPVQEPQPSPQRVHYQPFQPGGYCQVTVVDGRTEAGAEAGTGTHWAGCEPADTAAPPPGAPPVDRDAVLRQAVISLLVTPGKVGVLPGRALTGLETFFWVDEIGPRSTPEGGGPFGMTITAWPVGYRWEFGDGASMTGGPGNPDAPRSSEISHVYQRGGRLEARVVVLWAGSASSDAGTQPVPGPFTTTAAVPVQVDQIRSRLVR
jgi:hypothetical protein